MPNVALFKQDGTQNGEITLNEEIFESNLMKVLSMMQSSCNVLH